MLPRVIQRRPERPTAAAAPVHRPANCHQRDAQGCAELMQHQHSGQPRFAAFARVHCQSWSCCEHHSIRLSTVGSSNNSLPMRMSSYFYFMCDDRIIINIMPTDSRLRCRKRAARDLESLISNTCSLALSRSLVLWAMKNVLVLTTYILKVYIAFVRNDKSRNKWCKTLLL